MASGSNRKANLKIVLSNFHKVETLGDHYRQRDTQVYLVKVSIRPNDRVKIGPDGPD